MQHEKGITPVMAARNIEGDLDDVRMEELVRRAKLGDARAYEAVYRGCVGRIHGLCLRMLRNSEEAEELTQDVFVRAWERLETFRGDSRFTTWLHKLAVNLILQHRRSMGRRWAREQLTDDPGKFGTRAAKVTPGKKIDLERAIDVLPPKAQEVLILRDIEGYKYREVAELTGTAVGTVKAQVHRARRMVQEAMER